MSQSNRLGLLGRKVGMMRLFTDDGDAVPVTVVDVSNNRVTQVKTQENDGYVALQVTFGARKASRVTKPEAIDLWTALTSGLANQQVANDPGGDRWLRLVDDAVSMFLAQHVQTPDNDK